MSDTETFSLDQIDQAVEAAKAAAETVCQKPIEPLVYNGDQRTLTIGADAVAAAGLPVDTEVTWGEQQPIEAAIVGFPGEDPWVPAPPPPPFGTITAVPLSQNHPGSPDVWAVPVPRAGVAVFCNGAGVWIPNCVIEELHDLETRELNDRRLVRVNF